jgi:hypothetical protein
MEKREENNVQVKVVAQKANGKGKKLQCEPLAGYEP